jgi:hypothetical protein
VCHNGGTLKWDDTDMKFCPRCKEKKALDEFYRKRDRKAGSYCKICQLAYVREHYKRDPASYNARRYISHAAYKNRNRALVLAHLAEHPCVDCNETDILVLDFDHVRGTKICSISHMIRSGTAAPKLLAEMEKCVVRCANCHRRKTAQECGSYRIAPHVFEPVPALVLALTSE